MICLKRFIKLHQYVAYNKCRYLNNYNNLEIDDLQTSLIDTFHFQNNLLKLNVPTLEKSLDRYKLSQEAFLALHPDQLSSTLNHIETFRKSNKLAILDNNLRETAKKNKNSSYISPIWFHMYLADRRPVVLTHQPVMIFNDLPKSSEMKIEIRATNMIFSAVRFIRSLKNNNLKPDVYHLNPSTDNINYYKAMKFLPKYFGYYLSLAYYNAFPLDMSQFANLFFSTRLPNLDKDILKTFPESRHVVVIYRGHFYKFDIFDDSGRGVPPKEILFNIKFILQQNSDDGQGIGCFTSLPRTDWFHIRKKLQLLNSESLNAIDSSAFVMILDDMELNSDKETVLHWLHGPAHNRWFDKSFSLIVNQHSARSALTFEHSWGDGVAVMRLFNELQSDVINRPVIDSSNYREQGPVSSSFQKINWTLNDELKEDLIQANDKYNNWRNTLDFEYFSTHEFGRSNASSVGIGPDACMQLAFQQAFYSIHGEIPSTYESCSTAAFKHGRTETIRSATLETNKFVQKSLNSKSPPSPKELVSSLKACSSKHNKLTKEAAMGNGWDRHLFVLKNLAQNQGVLDELDLFTDPAYQNINRIRLSTSTLSSPNVLIGGFAATELNGYGVGYVITKEMAGCAVTNWKGHKTNAKQFCDAVEDALETINKVCLAAK